MPQTDSTRTLVYPGNPRTPSIIPNPQFLRGHRRSKTYPCLGSDLSSWVLHNVDKIDHRILLDLDSFHSVPRFCYFQDWGNLDYQIRSHNLDKIYQGLKWKIFNEGTANVLSLKNSSSLLSPLGFYYLMHP